MGMWIVVIDRPYYPDVDEFDSYKAAHDHYAQMVREEDDGDANDPKCHTTYVYLAHVETRARICTTH